MTDEQVQTAIEVLKAYVSDALSLENDILDELERWIEAAAGSLPGAGVPDYDEPSEMPHSSSW